MGNSSNKKKKTETSSKIGKEFSCPLCNQVFDYNTTYNTLNAHIITCAQINRNNTNNRIVLFNTNTNENIVTISPLHNNIVFVQNATADNNNNKAPSRRIFGKEKGDSKSLNNNNINNYNKEAKSFDEKIQTLRNNLECMKVDWRDAHCNMELDRENVLKESLKKFEKIDPYKELKINFKGEVSYDAGGIIREWFTVIVKELESPQLHLFERGDTDEFSYIINRNLTKSSKIMDYFNFLGKVMAKALLDNITLNLCFNKILYKMILNEAIKFEDLVFIDKQLYNSLSEMKKLENVDELGLYYVVEFLDEKGNLIRDDLVTNGVNELVTNVNDYIEKRIEYMVSKNEPFVKEIKKGLYEIISEEFLTIFNSDEFELLLNGQPFIDVEEWRANTIYQGKYSNKHKVIKWFWEVLFNLGQDELAKFFQFCTGSARVPIGGFSVLESNRGEVAKFCIVQANFNSKGNNYIKAHTCFNRIDLPLFTNEKQVKEAVSYVINNEILGFGID